MMNEEPVIWTNAYDRILLVTDSSSVEYRKLAHEVSKCANQEMKYNSCVYHHYDPPDNRCVHIFLYIRTFHAVGVCLFEKRSTVCRCIWRNSKQPTCTKLANVNPMWCVSFLWVHKQFRQSGIAYTLFKEAKLHLQLGKDDIAWYTPFSKEGESFVRRMYPVHFFVAS